MPIAHASASTMLPVSHAMIASSSASHATAACQVTRPWAG